MSGRSDPTDVSVTEKKAGYSGSSVGPGEDTAAYSRETPIPMEWTDPGSGRRGGGGTDPSIPNVRKSIRKAEDVDRDRPWKVPEWLPMAGAGVVVLLVLAGGVWWVLSTTVLREPPPPPPKPAPVEDLEGVPVRKGLNAPDGQ